MKKVTFELKFNKISFFLCLVLLSDILLEKEWIFDSLCIERQKTEFDPIIANSCRYAHEDIRILTGIFCEYTKIDIRATLSIQYIAYFKYTFSFSTIHRCNYG